LGRRSTALAWISTTTISVIGSSCHPQRGINVLLEVPEDLASPRLRSGSGSPSADDQKKDAYSAPGQADAKWKQVLVFSPSRTKKGSWY
jgi:hypothetical protein